MDIVEFANNYGTYFITVIMAIALILVIVHEIINYKSGIPIRVDRFFTVFIIGILILLTLRFLLSKESEQDAFFKPINVFFESIDWNFWGYYVLFPCILGIISMSIIKALKSNPKK